MRESLSFNALGTHGSLSSGSSVKGEELVVKDGDLNESDYELTETGLEKRKLDPSKPRHSVFHRSRIAERVQRANDLDFLNYL